MTYHGGQQRVSLSVDYMKIVLFIDAIDLYHRKSNVCYTVLATVPLEHLVEQTTPIFLGWHRVL